MLGLSVDELSSSDPEFGEQRVRQPARPKESECSLERGEDVGLVEQLWWPPFAP